MIKNMQGVLMALALASPVFGQGAPVDYGVASEVVRSMMSADVGRSILTSTNLMSNYRNFAMEQELAQEAARRGLTERIDVRRTIEDQRREVLITALRNEITRAAPAPADAAIKAEYNRQKDRLIMPAAQKLDVYSISATQTQVIEKARILLENDPGVAETLVKRGFVHLSGSLEEPWFTAAQVAPAIWGELAAMSAGDVEAFPDGNNVLLIRKYDNREARAMTFEEAEPGLRNALLRDAQMKLWNDYLEKKSRELGF